jgi:NADH-quinone oxidoreductase subunit J
MIIGTTVQILAFGIFSLIAIAGGLGMATTMSMFRSGIFLMASFIGVAGLFILLSADLLGLLQVMMYIGGMLVMILFMVLFSADPGGAMMSGMEMSPVEKFFSLGIQPMTMDQDMNEMDHSDMEMQEEGHSSNQSNDAMHNEHHSMNSMHSHSEQQNEMHQMNMDNGEGNGMSHDSQPDQMDDEMGDMNMGDMDMEGMSMVTPIRPLATVLASLIAALLVGLLLWKPSVWQISSAVPDPRSARIVGSLLMDKYMIAFEGAGLLILTGIFGAVMISRPGSHPSEHRRESPVEIDAPPAAIATDEPSHSHS